MTHSMPKLEKKIPSGFRFMTPKPADITEEGFGYFHDCVDLRGTHARDARLYLKLHKVILDLASGAAATDKEFDQILETFESGITDEEYSELIPSSGNSDLFQLQFDDIGGLEIGVGALSHALSAAKAFPAASCRSHFDPNSWSTLPVVYFQANEPRCRLVEKILQETECGFVPDPGRPEFLVIGAPSLLDMLEFTEKIMQNLSVFRELTTRKNRPSRTNIELVVSSLF